MTIVFAYVTCKIDFVGISERHRVDDVIVRKFLRASEAIIIDGTIDKSNPDEKVKAHKMFRCVG
jgi:hypothetical protein